MFSAFSIEHTFDGSVSSMHVRGDFLVAGFAPFRAPGMKPATRRWRGHSGWCARDRLKTLVGKALHQRPRIRMELLSKKRLYR